jgi:hypothetical protein
MAALRLPDLDKILPGEFQRGFDRFGATGHEIHVRNTGGRIGDQSLGQRLGHFGCEKTRMRIGKRIELPVHRCAHPRMTMAETGDGSAAGRVDVAAARRVDQMDALAANRRRQVCAETAMDNGGHRAILARDAR